jgi:2'-hydroxyisoflavone reductase
MRILVLGGTVFLGRAFVDVAIAAGHEVTIFHRGSHARQARIGVDEILGDRDSSMDALGDRTWDAVVDTCGFMPRVVRRSVERLKSAIGRYLFVSSRSVYADGPGHVDESSPRATLTEAQLIAADAWRPGPDELVPDLEQYGALKALCEDAVLEPYGTRAVVVRPGLIVGPHDRSDRFTYWPHRIARGGEVLAPGRPDRVVSFVDVRDLARFMLLLIERARDGVFDVIGPSGWSMATVLDTCNAVAGGMAHFTWVDEAFLVDQKVTPWTELPLWIEEKEAAFLAPRNDRALAAGLVFRSLADTARDTLTWDRTRPPDVERKNGMKPEREAELLRAWHDRTRS